MSLQPATHWARRMDVTVPRRRMDVTHRELAGEAVLYDPRTGCTHRMNHTALAVWRACDGRTTTRAVAERLCATYEVAPAPALEDVERTIAAFAQAGLVEEGPDV